MVGVVGVVRVVGVVGVVGKHCECTRSWERGVISSGFESHRSVVHVPVPVPLMLLGLPR